MENNCKSKNNDKGSTLYQVSLLQALTYGDYSGSVLVGELKEHGNTGIGTFDGLNGELIMLNGKVYRALGNGSVEVVSNDETTPFAAVAHMNVHSFKKLNELPNYDSLNDELNKLVKENGKNRFYMICIDGLFREINVRSVPKQKEPYKRLVDVLEEQQTFFDYENIEGTMVGLYCPPYMSHLNATGWHMHFISKDKTKGGHVLGVNIADATLNLCGIDSFELKLPQTKKFNSFDFTVDQSKDIEKVEKNK